MKNLPFQGLLKRFGLMAAFFVLYVFGIRHLRAFFSEEVVYQGLLSAKYSLGNAQSIFNETRMVLITYLSNGAEMSISYIPQFGFFFLFAMLGVIFFLPSKRVYLALVGFQVVVELMVLLLLWIGIHVTVIGFILADFLMVYFSPLICLGFVVYLSVHRRDPH